MSFGLFSSIKTIKNILSESQKEIFKKCCFGHFQDAKPLDFQAQVINSCLLREIVSDDVDGMWFRFGKDVHRFPIHEFGSITGLKRD